MARPTKNINLISKNLSEEEEQTRRETEELLRGGNDRIKPHSHLTSFQVEIFNYIVDELAASEILGNLDVYILEACAIAIDRLQDIESMINRDIDNLVNKSLMSAREKYTKDFFRCCNELSLSPQSRAKLGTLNLQQQQDDNDPLLKILNGGKHAD